MSKLLSWVRSWLALRRYGTAEIMARRWIERSRAVAERLNRRRSELAALRGQTDLIGRSLVEDLEEARSVEADQAKAVEALQSELEVLRNVTVPELTAAHHLILQRYDAETAIEVRRQMAQRPREE